MSLEVMLVQFLVLAFTAIVWWLARRDLSARAQMAQAPALADLENLRAVVEALVADLEFRADAAEQRVREAERRLEQRLKEPVLPTEEPTPPQTATLPKREGEEVETPLLEPLSPPVSGGVPAQRGRWVPTAPELEVGADPHYAPVYALLDEGVTDADEIARRTGLGQGEVQLILGLRARQL